MGKTIVAFGAIALLVIMFAGQWSLVAGWGSHLTGRATIEAFGGGVSQGLPTTGDYNCVGVGDLDGDGYQDLVIGAEENYGTLGTKGLYAYFGSGDGSWTQMTISDSRSYADIEVRDCDRDGYQEVYAGYQESAFGVGAWEWNGTGFSSNGITSPMTSGAVSYMRIENMTGGSGLDMAVGSQNGVRYYQSNGRSPISWTQYSTGLRSSGLCTAMDVDDMNNDGLLDMVVGQYGDGLYLFQQASSGTSWTDVSSTLPSVERSGRIMGLVSGDVNNDGNIDIVFNRMTSPGGMFLLMGNGGGSSGNGLKWTYLNSSWTSRPTTTFYQMQLADVDDDGDLDLLAAKEDYGLHLYLGNGSEDPGRYFGWTEVTGKGLPSTMHFFGSNYIDYDNDGDLDVAGCTWGNGARVYSNNITQPQQPVARAGRDITMLLGNTTRLDGTNSSDAQDCPDGDPTGTILSYDWNLTSQPSGSFMTDDDLSPSDNDARPFFDPTHEGNYTFTLSVRDPQGAYSIREDTVQVTVIMINTPPISDAGDDLDVFAGDDVILNGSGSYDGEDSFEQLTFRWEQNASDPTSIALSGNDTYSLTFVAPQVTGNYSFTLIVTDSLGLSSHPDMVNVTVSLRPNIPPTSDAGEDMEVRANATVHLNGSSSYDPDGTIVQWSWECSTHQSLTLSNFNTPRPSFVPNITGTYTFSLRVKDDRLDWSGADTVTVSVLPDNYPPVADAGRNLTVHRNSTVVLNGTLSTDPDGTIMVWDWRPLTHHGLLLSDNGTARPKFSAFSLGDHIFSLRVMDNKGVWSRRSIVKVTVVPEEENITEPVENEKPIIEILNPTAGNVLNGTVRIAWSVSDADLDPLTLEIKLIRALNPAVVLFSGAMPTDQYLDWNTSLHSNGTYRLEMTVNDGFEPTTQVTGEFSIRNERPPVVPVDDDDDDDDLPDDDELPVVPDGSDVDIPWTYMIAVVLVLLLLVLLAIVIITTLIIGRTRKEEGKDRSEE